MATYDSSKGKGKILKRADPSTIQDKFLVGYQGWFTCGGDGEPVGPGHHGWLHWFDAPIPDGGRPNIDLWPDVSSYSPSELFPAPGLKNKSGEQMFLFSSRHPKTVQRHFHWMAEHGVDGAFLQRFASQCDVEAGNEGIMRIRDEVGDRVREAAEKEGRVFAIMYDVSGVPPDRIQRIMERDWVHLIRHKGILDSPNYLKEKGKPVIALWGFGFEGAGHAPALVRAITTYIRNVTPGGAYIMAGTPAHWRTAESDADRNPEFLDVWLNDFDAISPWTVGRYRNEREADDFAETKMKGDAELIKKRNEDGRWRKIDYIPVVLPGASGFNLSQGRWGFNDIRRNGGRFLWKQIFNAKRQAVRTVYGAMWDEYDEGTAFMPVVEKKRMLPESDKHCFMALDEDGYDLPCDWYMRICGFAAEGLRSERRIHETFPSKELQDYWATRPKYEEVDHKSGDFVSGASQEAKGSSGSGGGDGQSYQEWLVAQKDDKEEAPPPPYSLEAEEVAVGQPQVGSASSAAAATAPMPSPSQPALIEGAERVSSPPVRISPTPGEAPASAQSVPQSGPARQPSGPPPINTTSRPQQPYNSPPHTAPGAPSASVPSSATTSSYPPYTYNNTPPFAHNNIASPHTTGGGAASDHVSSLADDFSRHGISSPVTEPAPSSTLRPPLHPAHPAAQGGRPQPSNTKPQSRPHTPYQPQSGHQPSNFLASSVYPPTQTAAPQPAGSCSQAQWPPPEWGIGGNAQTSTSVQQSSYPGQTTGGANLTRPQTFSASSHSASAPLRPHSSMSARPSGQSQGPPGSSPSPAHGQAGGPPLHSPSTPLAHTPGGIPPFPGPGASSYTPGRPSHGSGVPMFPAGPNHGSTYPPPASSYPGQVTASSYGPSEHTPPAQHGPGYMSTTPHQSPPHSPPPGGPSFPGGSYYAGQTPSNGFPAANSASYPGQASYGSGPTPAASQPPYGAPHGPGHSPNDRPPQGGGFHFPQAPGGSSYIGIPQPQSTGYAPGYIGQQGHSTPYGSAPHQGSMPSSSSGWYPGSSGSSASPMPPRPPSQSPYATPSSSGPTFPTASTSTGLLGTALNAVDKVAGKKTRAQLESVAQSSTKLLNKFTGK
ncbi:putative xylosidase arabinosidase [Lyophyllum shimeji]|uniref:Xylosidase arabinosidase n=1 Tax=Lyophyllum shimeji TaxID=47721 RepID=A0A9P3PIV0_LYOSH|nr:putative xylosidase arabinosidase [Lyophyllum shimeji]